MPARVLVVEDNLSMGELLKDAFQDAGHESVLVDTAAQAARVFDADRFDLALLDVNLREGTGYDVCRHIRAHPSRSATPVIMLTANVDPEQKAEGFSSGADNYLTKPINVSEVLLWAKALLRRAAGDWSAESVITAGDLGINPETHTVELGGKVVRGLTCMEFKLLKELARAGGKTLSRQDLESRVWGGGCRTNTVEVHVKTLRHKLGPQGAIHIVTVRGVGYRFE